MNAILVFLLRLIFILLSYVFIGWISYIIYQDFKAIDFRRKNNIIPLISLQTTNDQQQVRKKFSTPEIVIGRDPSCDFPISDDAISLRHCKLTFHHSQWWIEDLESTNGSYLNDTLVESPVVLTNGDQLRLGRKIFKICINSTLNGENNE